jgi:hypothetical protein
MPPNAAEIQGGKAVLRSHDKPYSPKEAVAALAETGIRAPEKRIREMVGKGVLPALSREVCPGRILIPESGLIAVFLRKEGGAA